MIQKTRDLFMVLIPPPPPHITHTLSSSSLDLTIYLLSLSLSPSLFLCLSLSLSLSLPPSRELCRLSRVVATFGRKDGRRHIDTGVFSPSLCAPSFASQRKETHVQPSLQPSGVCHSDSESSLPVLEEALTLSKFPYSGSQGCGAVAVHL